MKDDQLGLIIILVIIAIAVFGGAKNSGNFSFNTQSQTEEQKNQNIEQEIQKTQAQVDDLKKQIQAEEEKKYQSKYYNQIQIQYVNRSDNPAYEYVTLKYSDSSTAMIPITGWKIKSLSSGSQISIPDGTQLFFAGMVNIEENIVLSPGDIVYVNTGISPNGSNFRLNRCSGYLSESQTFIPYLYTNCPAPRYEDLSSIPKIRINDDCFDYIDSMPSCRTQTTNLPLKWSYECTNFIYNKINYPNCVNVHKNDKDFYIKEWRIYLKRSESVWGNRRENIVLYDSEGKIVSSLKY